MRNIDAATEQRLTESISYLRKISNDRLMVRLYQKIIFLLELDYYRKHKQLFIGIDFVSYKYGPFSIDIAHSLENPSDIDCSKEVKDKIDNILTEYNLKDFNIETQKMAYNKMIDYIHSLLFYNLTPFNKSLRFDNYQFDDLFATIESDLDGEKLEQERAFFASVRESSKEYRCQFQI